ncbi:Protein of unknown function [Chryseolinea serpens]|uniref:DUF3592 domain-containing protein n=1 Tax=Chryseolinea serpens TaxID=947013 RepID=A0A1M5K7T4_9BACT|nr:DUF3592 domain-containing protein [Chryseolinea serpens]SHG48670.1 Protein of unknown function [Chryseolinea serpens]
MNIQKNKSEQGEGLLGCAIAPILLVVLAYIGYQRSLDARYKRQIAASFSETPGEIVAYWEESSSESGSRSPSIQYSYRVEGNRYSRTVRTSIHFPDCEDVTSIACAQKRFWVIYSTEDPRKSLINLEIQIQDIEHPKFPETLDDFI